MDETKNKDLSNEVVEAAGEISKKATGGTLEENKKLQNTAGWILLIILLLGTFAIYAVFEFIL